MSGRNFLPLADRSVKQEGVGITSEIKSQPHAPVDPQALAFAPGAPLWGEDTGGNDPAGHRG